MRLGLDYTVSTTEQEAKAIKKSGYDIVARYLGHSWKTDSKSEANILSDADLKIVSILEKNPTYDGYFTVARAKQDLSDAISFAKELNQPKGTAIYFTVDEDMQKNHFYLLDDYFGYLKANLKDYKVGCYGSYDVCQYVHDKGLADYYWQTYAWSGGKLVSFANMYQYRNGANVAGISCDLDKILRDDVGEWTLKQEVKKPMQNDKLFKDWQAKSFVTEVDKASRYIKKPDEWKQKFQNNDIDQAEFLYLLGHVLFNMSDDLSKLVKVGE